MKKFSILALLALAVSSCSNTPSTNGNVTLKAAAVSSTGTTSLTARMASTPSTAIITDFKINVGSIKLETAKDDVMHEKDSVHEDSKLVGPFLLDLLDPNKPLSQVIASVNVPNAKYEAIKIMFEKSIVAGDMSGKTYLIKGTINGKDFLIWSDKGVELKMHFADPAKDFTVNSNDTSLNIKIQLDAIMAKLTTLANQGLLLDGNGDGVIEISTSNVDGNQVIGEQIRAILENESHLDDKD